MCGRSVSPTTRWPRWNPCSSADRPTLAVMNGILALQGGGPFVANDDLDRRLIAAAAATRVIMLPTADAYEHPELLVGAAMTWGQRLDVEGEGFMVICRG